MIITYENFRKRKLLTNNRTLLPVLKIERIIPRIKKKQNVLKKLKKALSVCDLS